MSQAVECRICHKGDTLGPRGVMLTCGQCKRHTHHSCLVPRMTNQHLVALLDTLKNPGAPQFGHPEVWMCPRCFGRNPEAAMKTILGRRFFKPTNSSGESSPAQAGPSRPGPSAPVSAAYKPRNSVRSASEQATSSAISVDDDDVEIIDSTASTPQRSATLSTGRSSSRLSMAMDVDDDEIQIVEGPPPSRSVSLSSSRQTSRAPSQTNLNMPPPSRSQSIISRAESMSGMYTSQSPAPLRPPPGSSFSRSTSVSTFSGTPVPQPRQTVNGSVRPYHPLPSRPTFAMGMELPGSQRPVASSSRHGLWTDLPTNTQKANNRLPIPRKRRQPSSSRARSESSEGPSDDPDFPEKRPRTDRRDTSESDRRLAPTVTTEDIRRIQAELRAQGKLAPPPTNYYTNRSESTSRKWWSTSAGASSGSGSAGVPREGPAASTSQSGPRVGVPKPASDDSDLEVTDGPRKSSSAERPEKRGRSGSPLFIPDSEESEDESRLSQSHTPPTGGVDVKGKGKARASSIYDDEDIKEEEQVEVKLEALDSLTLGGKSGKSRKRSPDILDSLPLHQWKANQKTMDGEDEPEDLKMLSNDKFRIVEKQESGRMGPRKIQHTQILAALHKRDAVNVVNHKTRAFSERVGARKREMPAWML
ncbi:hypothetical protein BC629DRAFT_1506704 [Irpex lacteus]|nr:hypothetical protein BC629DRAFT_1506704 [Irpex lacteus]